MRERAVSDGHLRARAGRGGLFAKQDFARLASTHVLGTLRAVLAPGGVDWRGLAEQSARAIAGRDVRVRL